MEKKYPLKSLLFVFTLIAVIVVSCSKDSKKSPVAPNNTATTATPTKFGLYEADSSVYKLLYTFIAKVGTQDVSSSDYALIFDTGSGGLVLDASGILPSSMITSDGFNFTTDSTVVDGITIYNQKTSIEYGDDAATTDKVYGYLAYAPITMGDENGTLAIKRVPFLLYYKAVHVSTNKQYPPHEFDVFGVSSEYDASFSNGAYITSPFSSFTPGTGLTNGFKMAALGMGNFSYEGTYVANAVTLGLTQADLSSNGFVMHQLTYYPGDGYAPLIPVSLTYNNKTISTSAIFDTGTEPYSYIEDSSAADSVLLLPKGASVNLSSNEGYKYTYSVTSSDNLTYVENPGKSQSDISVISLEFFLNNDYLLDYTDHKLGLKNN